MASSDIAILDFQGQRHTFETNQDLAAAAFEQLALRDPQFCEKCAPYVSHLRQNKEDFRNSSVVPRQLPGGWWVNVWGNRWNQENRIAKACEVAGVAYGRDLIAIFKVKQRESAPSKLRVGKADGLPVRYLTSGYRKRMR